MELITKTQSLCPECLAFLDADIFEDAGKVFIKKTCKEHGEFSDLYYGSYEMYKKIMGFASEGKGISNPNIPSNSPVCPKDCGLCSLHKSHTALGNIVVTNRCDLACFYCFFYAKAMGYVYEPTLEQIRAMLKSMKQEKPVAANAVQLTGGEPTIRKDLLEIIKIAKEEGYDHVQLNTNGINLSQDQEFAKKVRLAGVNTIYLSFDGTTEKTNPKNHFEIPKVLENCRKANLGIVLVPTIINTVNDFDAGNILKFGIENMDIVNSVNYQPVSLVGRITKADLKKLRITIPDLIQRLEEQTSGMVSKEDFYTIPTVSPITDIVEALTGKPTYTLSTHPVCGMATYLFIDGNKKAIPITRFVDVEGLMEYLKERAEEVRQGSSKILTSLKLLAKLNSFIDKEKQPANLKLGNILRNVLIKRNYSALGELQKKSLFVGMMHFMDKYNYDVERVKRCCIHYAQPDGTIVPFCAFNVIPEWYRDKIQEKYGLSIADWEKKTGKKLSDDLYKRDAEKLKKGPLYDKTYSGFFATKQV